MRVCLFDIDGTLVNAGGAGHCELVSLLRKELCQRQGCDLRHRGAVEEERPENGEGRPFEPGLNPVPKFDCREGARRVAAPDPTHTAARRKRDG